MTDQLQQAIQMIKSGDKARGRRLLARIVREEPDNERAWLWLAEVVENPAHKRQSLQQVLRLNPESQTARQRLAALSASSDPTSEVTDGKTSTSREEPSTPESANQTERRIPLLIVTIAVFLVITATIGGVAVLRWVRNQPASEVANESAAPTAVPRAAVPATFTAVPSPTPPAATYTAQPTHTPAPTYTPLPTSTAYPTQQAEVALPTLTPVPQFSGSAAEFRAYIREKYSDIAGQSLQIDNVTIFNEGGEFPHRSVSIQLTESSAAVFRNQPPSAPASYAETLLQDAVSYFKGQDCTVRVFELFYTDYLADRYFDEEWYYIGDYDLDDGWPIYRDYIWGHYKDGQASYDIWTGG